MRFPLPRRNRPVTAETARPPAPAPEMHVGETILPDEGAKSRINSAADVDPNIKAYGVLGGPGGAGGYGGAGTK